MAVKYLKKYGQAVIDNGYDICFIRPGEKRPFGKEWESVKHGPKRLASALANGRGGYGVGVKAAHTPGVDIDCYDEAVVKHMVKFTEKLLGKTLRRIGNAPKTLLVYKTDTPFRKVQSKTFIDDEGRAVKLEVLGDGQQWVAFHTHPDTEMPYEWVGGKSILDVEWSNLNDIERDDSVEITAEFERIARKQGWEEKNTVKRLADGRPGREARNDPFLTDATKVDLTPEALLKKLHTVPNADDYDTWFHVGMALYHQFDGDQAGLDMWHEWSSQAHNYDMDALDEKWPTFEIEGKSRAPITARFILKKALAEEERLAGEELDEIKEEISLASNHQQFGVVMDRIKHIAFPPMLRESLVVALRDRIKQATGTPMPVGMIRKQCAFENPDNRSTPAWLRDWVFIQHDESLYNAKTRQSMTTKAFDLSFGRFQLTKKDILEGVSTPEHSASHIAVHRYQIPAVANKMYMPLEDEFFEANGLPYVNSYSHASVPEMPDELSDKERRMCERLERHTEHLFRNERDRKLLLSWLAYIVQTGGKVNWAPVLQGVENDGKSFFGRAVAAAIGGDNVNIINGDALAEQYTSWAEGSQFLMVEEVRLHGADRFAVINKLKPYISNDMVTIRRMRTDSYKVFNTVNYFLTTNHKDGVPVNENSTRYFPLFSNFQTKIALDEFNAANPKYYKRLHALLQHGGALRRWFMEYELHPEFDPMERAKESSSLAEMRYLNQSEEEEGIAEILAESTDPELSRVLCNASKLQDAMQEKGIPVPYGHQWKRLMSERGFTPLGKVKVKGHSYSYWTQEPQRFMLGDRVERKLIRDWAEPI